MDGGSRSTSRRRATFAALTIYDSQCQAPTAARVSGTQEIYMGRLAADARAANAFEDAVDF